MGGSKCSLSLLNSAEAVVAVAVLKCGVLGLVQAMTELIYLVLQGGLYTCIVYFMAGFQKDAGKFFWVGFQCLRLVFHIS